MNSMLKKITLIIIFHIACQFSVVAQGSSIVDRLTNSYEQTQDAAFAYHLARITFALEKYSETAKWLSTLHQSDWKMGIDAAYFPANRVTPDISRLIEALNANRITGSGIGIISSTIRVDDPLLVPENIAYNSAQGIVYAGSLVAPRIARIHLNSTSVNDNLPLARNVNWGVVYGMKYHHGRRELWVLHNRREGTMLHGALTVLNDDGGTVKTYKALGERPVELNDLCFTEDKVYITDSTAGRIYTGDIDSDILTLFYDDPDINYPNGIACNEATNRVFVSDSRGVSFLGKEKPSGHQRLLGNQGISFGGIDGLYLSGEKLIGVQNYMGTPKIITADISRAPDTNNVHAFDIARSEFRIPTTGFIYGDCLYYIANSSLDAIGQDGSINPEAEAPKAAKVIALNISQNSDKCLLVTRSIAKVY